jgi:TatD family-associated radical SAM protein
MFLYNITFPLRMGDIVYFVRESKKHAYLNITPNYACTNDCVFCDKHLLEGAVQSNLFLEKEPSLDEVISELHAKVDKKLAEEFVFCGIGEPLLYLDKVLDITKHIKKEYDKPIRINTNGQAYLIYPNRDVVNELEQSGVNSISISLNVLDSKAYKMLHRPKNREAFDYVLKFVKDCNSSSIYTIVSFLEFPKINRQKVLEFTKSLGLKNEQVRFRHFIKK